MRTQNVKPKIADEVRIPKNLLQFFREVHQLIQQGHELVTTSSDDLIQAEFAYGGLMEDGRDRFSFTFFPNEGTEPSWEFELSSSDIAAVVKGRQKTLRLWRCRTPDCGYRFRSADDTCIDCDYIDNERDTKASLMAQLCLCRNREDWVEQYLHHYPTAHELQIIGDYNSAKQLPKSWRPFSLAEMQTLVRKLR
jgi:hypothetical protein